MEIKEEKGIQDCRHTGCVRNNSFRSEKSNRVFQKKVQTYMGIASTVTADTEHSACILPGSDMRTGGTLIQYQETDWRFLKRMASQLGLPLVPDTSYYYPRFYLGLPEGEKGNWEKSFPVISVLMGDIMRSVENALLIGKISFVMMLLRGQACRWGTE